MKDKFYLYIDSQLVDFEVEPQFPVTYQLEDLSNPTIIKNNFSKTIKIEGTDNNNRIFGEIYNLEREQIYDFQNLQGVYFDPSQRTPFALYKNSELLESGYMQLTDITIKNKKITYNITLYGGLGDFFYSLMYNEDGEKKTLGDLWYKIEDENGSLLSKENELDFVINKDFVKASWDKLKDGASGNTINDFISFAPAYNGLYDEFASNKFLVNTWGSQLFMHNNITENDVEYSPYNGYLLAEVATEFTEWEVRDLRSYMQRPCLCFKKLFNALCDEDNNGGYKVNLDESFFNEKNPYFDKAYMALPLLPATIEGDVTSYKSQVNIDNTITSNWIGTKDGSYIDYESYSLSLSGDINSSSTNEYEINLEEYPVGSTVDINIDFSLKFTATQLNNTFDNSKLYLSYTNSGTSNGVTEDQYPRYKSILCRVGLVDENDKIINSKVLNFTTPINVKGKQMISNPSLWGNYMDFGFEYVNVLGYFQREGNTNTYKWVTNSGTSNFYLNIEKVQRQKKFRLFFSLSIEGSDNSSTFVTNSTAFKNWNGITSVVGYATAPLFNTSDFIVSVDGKQMRTDTKILKRQLLKTEFSPADVLLDYCKLFGLYFTKDIHSKTINIMTKNNFFRYNIIDINDRIDHSNDFKISPFLFETKYYLMKNEENESYYSKLYKDNYNLIYGQKRIDTNYNFNKDTQDVYEGSVFQNAISVCDTSPYYKTFWSGLYDICPCWMTETVTLNYFNVNPASLDTVESIERTYGYKHWINYNYTNNWNTKSGYDMFPKTCFYSLDNNSKSLSDISSTLLFFNGFKETKDAGDPETTQGTPPFWLTDDLYEMLFLNDGEVCYLFTEIENNKNGEIIAHKYTELPQFIRYITDNNTINESWDFGKPKEIYIPNINYSEDATLYNKFWENFLTDRYDVNTRKINCYVNLEGMKINQESLRDFYYFNNAIWVINKIENYYPNSYKTTKVEFVKVNDIDNYLNAQQLYEYPSVTLSESEATVDYYVTTYSIDVTATNNWHTLATLEGTTITPSSGTAGTTSVTLTVEPNNRDMKYYTPFTFVAENGMKKEFKLYQLPSPLVAKLIYGYVYNEKTQKPYPNCEIYFRNSSDENYTAETIATTNAEGYYEIYLGKDNAEEYGTIWVVIVDEKGDEITQTVISDWDSLEPKERRDFVID